MFRRVVFLSALFLSSFGAAQASSFMPNNDLWMEDCLSCKSTNMTQETFNKIIDAGYEAYRGDAAENNEQLIINKRWTDSTVNANVMRSYGQVIINMFGGLARRPEILNESFALVLCHELGHAYAGAPYIRVESRMSAEGMSDYYSTKECFRRVSEALPMLRDEHVSYESFIEEKCGDNDFVCRNSLAGAHGLGRLLATFSGESEPLFETPDPTVVSRTQLSYPATTQCRLDSYAAGALRLSKPQCWFKN